MAAEKIMIRDAFLGRFIFLSGDNDLALHADNFYESTQNVRENPIVDFMEYLRVRQQMESNPSLYQNKP